MSKSASVESIGLKVAALPPAVAAFVRAVNAVDLEGVVEAFAGDALVNDRLRELWGCSAIGDWAARELIDDKLLIGVGSRRRSAS